LSLPALAPLLLFLGSSDFLPFLAIAVGLDFCILVICLIGLRGRWRRWLEDRRARRSKRRNDRE
jgi:hypothetical protein